jgi:NitT/TauT family transport system substrate-binding protein
MMYPLVSFAGFRFLGLLLVIFLGACSKTETPLRVGTNVWAGYEFLYLAREKGWYPQGVRLVELTSASDVMDAMREGDLEAAGLTLDETLTLLDEGLDLVVVLVFDESAGADVLMTRPAVGAIEGLKGRTIAVETTALGALMLKGVLDKSGLDIEDVDVKHLSLREHLEAYRRGEIDAAITFAPYDSALAASGAVRMFDSRDIPGQIVDVLAVKRDALTSHADTLHALAKGYFDARRFLAERPSEALSIINQRLKLPEAELPAAFEGLRLPSPGDMRVMLSGNPSPLQTSARTLAVLMRERELLPSTPTLTLTHFTDPRFLPETP